jgi:hypothetical protein
LDISNLNNGNYYLKIINSADIQTIKFIKF